MRILGMDTCTDAVSVATLVDGVLEGQVLAHVQRKHSETLLPEAQRLLDTIGISLADVDALGTSVGPGSFTGVRIGVATMSALSYVLGVPVCSVSTLDAMLAMLPRGIAACAMLDARRSQVYVKAEGPGGVILEESAMGLAEALARLRGEGPVLFTGDAARLHEETIRRELPESLVMPEAASWPTAAGVCLCVAEGRATAQSHETLRPVYLRMPQAERERLERLKRNS